jgi:hypothetical protein
MSHVTQVFPTSERLAHCGSACAGPSRVASPKSQVSPMHVRMRRSFPIAREVWACPCGRGIRRDGRSYTARSAGAVLRARIAHEKILGQDRLKNNAPYRAQASGTREVCGYSRTPRPATRPCVACLRLRRLPSCDGSTQRAHLDSELRLRTRTSRESGGRRSRRECW